jgi:hypothetical protein
MLPRPDIARCFACSVSLLVGLQTALLVACGSESTESNAGASTTTSTSSHGGSGAAGGGGQTGGGGQAAAGGQAGGGGSGGATAASGSIVPLYAYPTDPSWDTIIAAKSAHPAVDVRAIINPDSGPGPNQDAFFAQGITNLDTAGIAVLGYVATTYGAKPAADVHAEIDTYKMESAAGAEAYYTELTTYAKAQGFVVTVGNPGTDVAPSYVGTVDTIFIYESAGLPDPSSLGGWHTGYDPSNFGIIPYDVPTLDTDFVTQARAFVRFVYLTDDVLDNPWNTLPPYFSDLLAALE